MTDQVTIRPLKTQADFCACEEIQRQVWEGGNLSTGRRAEIVPVHLLLAVAHSGGVVLGAFDGGRMVGFVFGFLGTSERYTPEAPAAVRLKHCSHMLAVLPEWQDRGVGYALKLAQREAARAQALRLMTWTYDPLESRNAYFNIARLGAVCNTYIRDLYGPLDDALNRGLPTDRFRVDWYIASKRVATRLARGHRGLPLEHFTSAGALLLNPPQVIRTAPCGEAGIGKPPLLYPCERPLPPEGTLILVEIPPNFQTLKRAGETASDLPLAWRLHTRRIFEAAFEAGYIAIDFIHEKGPQTERSLYVLAHTGDAAPPKWSIFADDIVGARSGPMAL